MIGVAAIAIDFPSNRLSDFLEAPGLEIHTTKGISSQGSRFLLAYEIYGILVQLVGSRNHFGICLIRSLRHNQAHEFLGHVDV